MNVDAEPSRRRLRRWIVGLALALGAAAEIVPNAGRLSSDGVAYLDLAHRLASGHLQDAFIGYWSPLLSILMAPVLAIVPLAPPLDTYLAFAVQFCVFVLAALGFRYLLRQLPRTRTGGGPDAVLDLLMWALFAWATLGLIRLHYISPDLLAAALFFWAVGAALRAGRGSGWKAGAAALAAGGLWGLAGVAKAAMIPLAVVGIPAVAIGAPGWRQAFRRGGLALAGWLLVAGSFIVGLSVHAGYPTIGSAGRLNYQWAVVDQRGESGGAEVVERIGVRVIPVEPGVTHYYRYDPPRARSASTDPGIPVPSFHRQLRRLMASGEAYWYLVSPLAAALLALLLVDAPGGRVRRWRVLVPAWLPALAGLGAYALVWVEARYVAGFLAVLALTVAAGVRPAERYAPVRTPILGGLAVVLATFAVMVGAYTARLPGQEDADVARRLHEVGPERGDAVAVVGSALALSPALRSAGLHVAATVARGEARRFAVADSAARSAAFDAMAEAGARWVVYDRPVRRPGSDWRRVRGANVWVRSLVGGRGRTD